MNSFLCRFLDLTKDSVYDLDDWIYDCELDESDLIEFIRDHLESENLHVWDINLKSLVFEFILNKADVSELVDYIDISSKDDIDLKTKKENIEAALSTVLVEDRNDAWLFLAGYFGIDTEIEEDNS